MKTKILLLAITLSSVSVLSAQTTDVGTFKNKTGNGTAITAYTDSALGVGTALPEGKAEIRYCPPPLSEHSGLLVTRVFCHGPLGTSLGGGGGTLGGGLSDGTTGEGQSLPNGGVVQVPHYFTPNTPLRFPIQSINGSTAPLLWLKTQELPSGTNAVGSDNSRLLVLPDGRTGINVANPRAALDVRGFGQNTPAAIFGVRAQRSSFTIAGNPLPQQYTKHVEVVPDCSQGAYNSITQNSDLGLFFTDGLGNEGSNQNGALVIGPWRNDGVGAGLRMEPNGNLLIKGSVEAQGKITCNGFVSKPKWWPDYVFESSYHLITLDSVKNYIKLHGHLPGVPSAQTIVSAGQDVPYLQLLQQQKIEELTLYVIEQNRKIKLLEKEFELIYEEIRTKNSNKK